MTGALGGFLRANDPYEEPQPRVSSSAPRVPLHVVVRGVIGAGAGLIVGLIAGGILIRPAGRAVLVGISAGCAGGAFGDIAANMGMVLAAVAGAATGAFCALGICAND